MAWAEFSQDHDHRVEGHTTIAYKAGMRVSVTRDCLDQAVALGRAVEIEAPTRTEEAGDGDPEQRPAGGTLGEGAAV